MNILLIDNYDSFTWNLAQMLEQWGSINIEVVKNDAISISHAGGADGILISPGPGIPGEAGAVCDIIRELAPLKSILGICLGCQAIAEVFGGKLFRLAQVRHGMAVDVNITKSDVLFNNISGKVTAGLYHSWAVSGDHLPSCLEVTAVSHEGVIMALRHKTLDVRGLQFHPESIMTQQGRTMLWNWLHHVREKCNAQH